MTKQVLGFLALCFLIVLLNKFPPPPLCSKDARKYSYYVRDRHALLGWRRTNSCFQAIEFGVLIGFLICGGWLMWYVREDYPGRPGGSSFQGAPPAPGTPLKSQSRRVTLTPKQGSWGDSASPDGDIDARMEEAGFGPSANLKEWLDAEFPPGVPERVLREALVGRKYRGVGIAVYRNDPSICSAILPPYFLVFWKSDAARNLVWARGFEKVQTA
jgi:hypothetical protein